MRYWYLWCHFYRIPITLKPRCFFSFSFFSTQSPLYFILPTHLFRCDVLRIKLVSDFFCFNVAEGGKKLATTTLRIEANLIDDADDILVIFRFTIEFIEFSASFCFEWRKSMKMINDDDIDFFGFCCFLFFFLLFFLCLAYYNCKEGFFYVCVYIGHNVYEYRFHLVVVWIYVFLSYPHSVCFCQRLFRFRWLRFLLFELFSLFFVFANVLVWCLLCEYNNNFCIYMYLQLMSTKKTINDYNSSNDKVCAWFSISCLLIFFFACFNLVCFVLLH